MSALHGVEQLQWIESQIELLDAKLTPEAAERLREHRIRGIMLLRQRLAALGPYPATTPDERAVWESQKRQIEEDVQLEMQAERLMEPPLEEAWDVWLAKDKLKALKDNAMVDLAAGMGGDAGASITALSDQGAGTWVPDSLRMPSVSPGQAYRQQADGHMHTGSPHAAGLSSEPPSPPHRGPHEQDSLDPHQQHVHEQHHQHAHEHSQLHMGGHHVPPDMQHYDTQHHLPPQAHHDPALTPLDMDPGNMKLCRRCNTHKPLSQFYKSKANSDGHDGRCKACDALQCAERRRKKQRVEQPTVENKTCRRCGAIKLATDFYRNKTNPDGLYNNCKACFAADAAERRSRLAPLEDRAVSEKTCKRCQTTKPASEFYRNKLMADGLYSHCKVCYGQAASERSADRQVAAEKLCRRCKVVKTAEEFYHSKMTSDGLQSYCKQCYAQAAVARRERISQQNNVNNAAHPLPGEPQGLEQSLEDQAAQERALHLDQHLQHGLPDSMSPGASLGVQLDEQEVPQLMHNHVHAAMPPDY